MWVADKEPTERRHWSELREAGRILLPRLLLDLNNSSENGVYGEIKPPRSICSRVSTGWSVDTGRHGLVQWGSIQASAGAVFRERFRDKLECNFDSHVTVQVTCRFLQQYGTYHAIFDQFWRWNTRFDNRGTEVCAVQFSYPITRSAQRLPGAPADLPKVFECQMKNGRKSAFTSKNLLALFPFGFRFALEDQLNSYLKDSPDSNYPQILGRRKERRSGQAPAGAQVRRQNQILLSEAAFNHSKTAGLILTDVIHAERKDASPPAPSRNPTTRENDTHRRVPRSEVKRRSIPTTHRVNHRERTNSANAQCPAKYEKRQISVRRANNTPSGIHARSPLAEIEWHEADLPGNRTLLHLARITEAARPPHTQAREKSPPNAKGREKKSPQESEKKKQERRKSRPTRGEKVIETRGKKEVRWKKGRPKRKGAQRDYQSKLRQRQRPPPEPHTNVQITATECDRKERKKKRRAKIR
ncbi:hypothetical protein C8J57DRAFT_1668650 [Mycena rebaudengoi]|nr:hypothetical protein C8J57DRAFT_1668650 [Mycena rebaudengoi]